MGNSFTQPVVQADEALLALRETCRCEVKELRWNIASNGAKYYQYQCVKCYKQSQNVSKVHAKGNERQLVYVSHDALIGYSREIQAQAAKRQDDANRTWWNNYNAYLQTPKWRAKREAVVRRDEHLCQACLSARATDVHHLTYSHLFDEPLFDLIAVCRPCHDRITAMDRAKRGA